MNIRKAQMEALNKTAEGEFRDRLREMLEEDYPEEVEDLGEEQFEAVIELGIAQARKYGIEREKDIGLYFDVMFSLAYDFDTNAEYPWAAQVLNRKDLSGQAKVGRVARLAQQELEREEERAEQEGQAN